jgi:hypothetical protein
MALIGIRIVKYAYKEFEQLHYKCSSFLGTDSLLINTSRCRCVFSLFPFFLFFVFVGAF